MDRGAGNDPKARICELASKLDDFNFNGLEVQDFTGMILGKAIDDKDWKEIAELVNQKRRRQELESAKATVRADISPGQEMTTFPNSSPMPAMMTSRISCVSDS